MKLFGTIFSLSLLIAGTATAQTISKEDLSYLSQSWKGERFSDGRPKVSDELLNRAKKIGIDEAWTVLQNEGYFNQFEGGWKSVNDSVRIVGRAVTASFMPSRPDVLTAVEAKGKKDGRKGATNAWPIATLQRGDVLVVDNFGKIKDGTIVGDNLGSAIFNKTGTGIIVDGAVRDHDGLSQIKGFNAFVRDFHPSFLKEVMLMGLNTPIRIGQTFVMPGDLVITDKEGVLFIPAHLAESVVGIAEFIDSKDRFGKDMMQQNKFSAGEIDSQWSNEVREGFIQWLKTHPEERQISRKQLDEFLSKRTW
jgi:regulator of RNase E activity RraA